MKKEKIKVLNIIGWGRSGSTMLGNVLGHCEGFFFGGELRNIWKLSLLKNRLCGCGVPLKECNFWNSVLEKSFNKVENLDVKLIVKQLEKTTKSRAAIFKLSPYGEKHFLSCRDTLEAMEKLYSGIQTETNCRIIVDATKAPLYSYMLSLLEKLDVYVIHLIRDPRGVAYSRKKKIVQPDKKNAIYLEQFNPMSSSLLWNVRNLISEYLWKKYKKKYLMVRYEDFALEPERTVNNILNFTGESNSKTPFISDRTVRLGHNHSVWGNPSRFKTGDVELKLDDEWRNKLGFLDKAVSTICTLPLLVKYGYKIN